MNNILPPVPDEILMSKALPVTDPDEIITIIRQLEREMSRLSNCLGLAAPQIGIPRAIAIIRHSSGVCINLINPEIKRTEDPCVSPHEGCMSYPGRQFHVPRFKTVWIETDIINVSEDGSQKSIARQPRAYNFSQSVEDHGGVICLAVQHEIDHLNGIVLPNKEGAVECQCHEAPPEPVKAAQKVGRNDPCPCGSGKKYKKCCLA